MKKSMITILLIALALWSIACTPKSTSATSGNAVIQSNIASSDTNNSGSSNAKAQEAPASDFSYEWTDDRKGVRITRYTGRSNVLVIPATIEGLPVMEIGREPLEGIKAVTEIVFPKSVINIVNLTEAKNLTKINLPDGLKKITTWTFATTNLRTVKLPGSVEIIEDSAFRDCKNLTTINLPASLKEISYKAFYGCSELNNLIIPDSLINVNFTSSFGKEVRKESDNQAFTDCGKLPLATRARIESWGYKSGF